MYVCNICIAFSTYFLGVCQSPFLAYKLLCRVRQDLHLNIQCKEMPVIMKTTSNNPTE